MPHALLRPLEGPWEDGSRPKDLYVSMLARNPAPLLPVLLQGLRADSKRVRDGCAELASLLAADHPELLWPHLAIFQGHLGGREPVLRWEAACTLGHLAAADREGRILESVPVLVAFLRDKSIVLQGHAARALARIGKAHPSRAAEILEALVSAAPAFPGNRVGYVVEAAGELATVPGLAARVEAWVTPYVDSPAAPVARKARAALRQARHVPA